MARPSKLTPQSIAAAHLMAASGATMGDIAAELGYANATSLHGALHDNREARQAIDEGRQAYAADLADQRRRIRKLHLNLVESAARQAQGRLDGKDDLDDDSMPIVTRLLPRAADVAGVELDEDERQDVRIEVTFPGKDEPTEAKFITPFAGGGGESIDIVERDGKRLAVYTSVERGTGQSSEVVIGEVPALPEGVDKSEAGETSPADKTFSDDLKQLVDDRKAVMADSTLDVVPDEPTPEAASWRERVAASQAEAQAKPRRAGAVYGSGGSVSMDYDQF